MGETLLHPLHAARLELPRLRSQEHRGHRRSLRAGPQPWRRPDHPGSSLKLPQRFFPSWRVYGFYLFIF